MRDCLHVTDLAEGHVAALSHLDQKGGLLTVNLGTGCGYSVLEMVAAFEKASGRPIRYRIARWRVGDVAQFWADPSLAKEFLGWRAKRGPDQMCADEWRWQQYSEGLSSKALSSLMAGLALLVSVLFRVFERLSFP